MRNVRDGQGTFHKALFISLKFHVADAQITFAFVRFSNFLREDSLRLSSPSTRHCSPTTRIRRPTITSLPESLAFLGRHRVPVPTIVSQRVLGTVSCEFGKSSPWPRTQSPEAMKVSGRRPWWESSTITGMFPYVHFLPSLDFHFADASRLYVGGFLSYSRSSVGRVEWNVTG